MTGRHAEAAAMRQYYWRSPASARLPPSRTALRWLRRNERASFISYRRQQAPLHTMACDGRCRASQARLLVACYCFSVRRASHTSIFLVEQRNAIGFVVWEAYMRDGHARAPLHAKWSIASLVARLRTTGERAPRELRRDAAIYDAITQPRATTACRTTTFFTHDVLVSWRYMRIDAARDEVR